MTACGLAVELQAVGAELGSDHNFQESQAAQVTYLTNALGQRVFAGEPRAEQSLPDEDSLGEDFITWLRRTFGWLFSRAQSNTSLGSAFVFGDGPIPPWAVLGEYDNGSASGKGRTEYIWLPTADGAIPIAVFRNNKFFSIHSDHLGTPRQMRSEANQVLWQWPYSAFGDNPPSGMLKATPRPNAAITHQPLLKATKPPQALDLRFAGQYADAHAGQFYNLHRMYMASQGRYTQGDPIGLVGGWNRFGYAHQSPLSAIDPDGLTAIALPPAAPLLPILVNACLTNPVACAGVGGWAAGSLIYPFVEKPLGKLIDLCMNNGGVPREECKQQCVKDYEIDYSECGVAYSFWGRKGYQACLARAGERLDRCMRSCDGK